MLIYRLLVKVKNQKSKNQKSINVVWFFCPSYKIGVACNFKPHGMKLWIVQTCHIFGLPMCQVLVGMQIAKSFK
jgi:hypothetical protein